MGRGSGENKSSRSRKTLDSRQVLFAPKKWSQRLEEEKIMNQAVKEIEGIIEFLDKYPQSSAYEMDKSWA